MHQGKFVFAQVMTHLPLSTFRRCVARHRGEHKVKSFSCLDQFCALAFAQLAFHESLRDIEACSATQGKRLHHRRFRSRVARISLANANATRPWQIYDDLAQHLIAIARPLYANEPIGVELNETVYAFDATTIDLPRGWQPLSDPRQAGLAFQTPLLATGRSLQYGYHLRSDRHARSVLLQSSAIRPRCVASCSRTGLASASTF